MNTTFTLKVIPFVSLLLIGLAKLVLPNNILHGSEYLWLTSILVVVNIIAFLMLLKRTALGKRVTIFSFAAIFITFIIFVFYYFNGSN